LTRQNPYSSPLAEPGQPAPSGEPLRQIAHRTFLAWERLRVIYIVVLGALTLLLGWQSFGSFDYWVTVVGGAVVANVCFFAGPIVETYVSWLGYQGKWLRTSLLMIGTIFSCLLAVAALAMYALPSPN
jgi:cytochrome c oxidase subunit IV